MELAYVCQALDHFWAKSKRIRGGCKKENCSSEIVTGQSATSLDFCISDSIKVMPLEGKDPHPKTCGCYPMASLLMMGRIFSLHVMTRTITGPVNTHSLTPFKRYKVLYKSSSGRLMHLLEACIYMDGLSLFYAALLFIRTHLFCSCDTVNRVLHDSLRRYGRYRAQ